MAYPIILLQRWDRKHQEFKIWLCYIVSSRPTLIHETVSKTKIQELERWLGG